MFKHIKKNISKIINVVMKLPAEDAIAASASASTKVVMENIATIDISEINTKEDKEDEDTEKNEDTENNEKNEDKKSLLTKHPLSRPFVHLFSHPNVNPLTLADCAFKYDPSEMSVIENWKLSPKHDIRRLIAMIQQLYFFSECNKRRMRSYDVSKNDITKIIEKIRRRPHLMIDTSAIDIVHDYVSVSHMFHKLASIVGMFHINEFMVRVEHAFDNSQIESEHFVVQQLMTHSHYDGTNCIDSENHIVLPVCVQLNSIGKIPESARTMFHHISYSIQPVVMNSHTIDVWFRRFYPTNKLVLILCAQMAKALVHLHAHDIVHGDIKPGNTLVHFNDSDLDSDSESSLSSDSDDFHNHSNANANAIANDDWESSGGGACIYLIDYGMSGAHDESDGTGGTKPYCAPETGNGCGTTSAVTTDNYKWSKNKKENDMWSFGLMFFTMIVLRKCISHPKEYPADFFENPGNGHIRPEYFNYVIDESTRSLFRRVLCPIEQRLTAVDFLREINEINKAIANK